MSFVPKFELTERVACKASIMIEGLTGLGKSGLALMLGFGLAGGFKTDERPVDTEIWKKIFAVDTENKSLNLFVGLPSSWGSVYQKFMSFQLTADIGYRPSNYLILRNEAVKNHAEVFIADSITHMWNAKGGVLDMVNEYKQQHPKDTDNYRVWGQPNIQQEKLDIIDTMRHSAVHNIVTVRVKEKFDMQWNEVKKANDLVSLGEQQIQQGELKYEPDLVLHMLVAGNPDGTAPVAKVIKSRYAIFKKDQEYTFTPELCEQLREYLDEGVDASELLEKQRQDYIQAVREHLDNNPGVRPIWQVMKKDEGYETTKLEDIPLDVIKK
jgi:hypothetical protein